MRCSPRCSSGRLRGSFKPAHACHTTYTRKRGLDHETNKALLLQHLKSQGEAGAPLSEFRQVLPALPMKAVQKLLDELRNDGSIRLLGQRRWARWYLADAAVFTSGANPKG